MLTGTCRFNLTLLSQRWGANYTPPEHPVNTYF